MTALIHEAADESTVHYVDGIIRDAISRKASDIHIEPYADYLRLRFRLDGILYDQPPCTGSRIQTVIPRIKILSGVNIAEKRLPQDGRFSTIHADQSIDIRVSTFPSAYGEKVVLRILDRATHRMNLAHLGFEAEMLTHLRKLLKTSSGFFLVTGPTGSGKTTTLYAALAELNSPEKNIITLEDPVEYCLDGITQGHIHLDGGFTFAKGLRALLRQDPDIAMVGEIRDKETAQIAIEAALTGHLVLSTLHTTDAPSALIRLIDMGIEPFLLNAAITGILAQRLARKNCPECTQPTTPSAHEKTIIDALHLPITSVAQGKGCSHCFGIGMKGRIGILELLEPSHELKMLLMHRPALKQLAQQAITDGMKTLMLDGAHKVNSGLISLQEALRVIC